MVDHLTDQLAQALRATPCTNTLSQFWDGHNFTCMTCARCTALQEYDASASALKVEPSIERQWRAIYERICFAGEPVEAVLLDYGLASAQGDWQPISSAPKDGTAILLLYKGHALEAAWQCVDSGDWETSQGPTYYWYSIFDCFDDGTEPTHWMPLPAAPAAPAAPTADEVRG